MYPNPHQLSRLSSTLRLVSGLGLLFLLVGCGPQKPQLDLETGLIEAPPALPPASMERPALSGELREDPMAPPPEVPNIPQPDTTATGTTNIQPLEHTDGSAPAAASKVDKALIQVPE